MDSPKTTRDADEQSATGEPSPSGTPNHAHVAPAGTPRWVKVSAVIAVVVVLLIVAMLLFGGGPGGHGPQRHLGGDGATRQTPADRPVGGAQRSQAGEQSGNHTGPPPGVEHGPSP